MLDLKEICVVRAFASSLSRSQGVPYLVLCQDPEECSAPVPKPGCRLLMQITSDTAFIRFFAGSQALKAEL